MTSELPAQIASAWCRSPQRLTLPCQDPPYWSLRCRVEMPAEACSLTAVHGRAAMPDGVWTAAYCQAAQLGLGASLVRPAWHKGHCLTRCHPCKAFACLLTHITAGRCDQQAWTTCNPGRCAFQRALSRQVYGGACRPVAWHEEDVDEKAEEKQISVHMVHVQDGRAVIRVRPGLSRLMPSCCGLCLFCLVPADSTTACIRLCFCRSRCQCKLLLIAILDWPGCVSPDAPRHLLPPCVESVQRCISSSVSVRQ